MPTVRGITSWVKCEFHCHAKDDPKDRIKHSTAELLSRAKAEGFGFVALTLHETVHFTESFQAEAASANLLCAPSCELLLEGKDVVAINCPLDLPNQIKTFQDLRSFKKTQEGQNTLLIAPHPHYILGGSMGHRRLMEYSDCFDAIELCHLGCRWLDPSRLAKKAAKTLNITAVATSDAHSLKSFGPYHTLVKITGEPTWEKILSAVRKNEVLPVKPTMAVSAFAKEIFWVLKETLIRKRTPKSNQKANLEKN